MKSGLWIGIDGGGTHSTAVAAWLDGRVAAVAHGGGLNFHHAGTETVRLRLESMVRSLCAQAEAPVRKICVGMSALDGEADAETLAKFTSDLLPPGTLDLQSDAYAALMGFTLGEPGMIVICGTGSMLLLMDGEGWQHVSGGWGYLLGDPGSGYALARDALAAVAGQADGTEPGTTLTSCALAWFAVQTPRKLIDRIYAPDCTPDRLAGFAPCVIREAERGDSVAGRILRQNMAQLAAQADALFKKSPSPPKAGLYGGIFGHSETARQLFIRELQIRRPDVRILDPEFPPEIGAIIHLMCREGVLDGEVLLRLKTTYQEMTGG